MNSLAKSLLILMLGALALNNTFAKTVYNKHQTKVVVPIVLGDDFLNKKPNTEKFPSLKYKSLPHLIHEKTRLQIKLNNLRAEMLNTQEPTEAQEKTLADTEDRMAVVNELIQEKQNAQRF